MPNLELDDIPSGYTPTIQPRSLPSLATVGSPISSTYASGIYSFDVTALANAEYEVELIGVSVPTRRFYIRKTSTVAFVIAEPGAAGVPPPAEANTCRVRVVTTQGAIGKPLRLLVETVDKPKGNEDQRAFIKVAFDATTDSNGEALVDCPWSSIEGVGDYKFRIYDAKGIVVHERIVTIPDVSNIDYGALVTVV